MVTYADCPFGSYSRCPVPLLITVISPPRPHCHYSYGVLDVKDETQMLDFTPNNNGTLTPGSGVCRNLDLVWPTFSAQNILVQESLRSLQISSKAIADIFAGPKVLES